MATSGELIRTVTSVLGLPEATGVNYYRSLREAGLVTKAGRGISAAKMTPRDAAHLIIAAGGSRFEKDAAEKIVRDFDRVQAAHGARVPLARERAERRLPDGDWIEGEGVWTFDGLDLPQLQRLPPRHSLADALEAIIETAMARGFERALAAAAGGLEGGHWITLGFYGPEPRADIEIDFWPIGGEGPMREELGYLLAEQIDRHPGNNAAIAEALDLRYGSGDLEIRRKITHRTIYAVADLLAGRAENVL